MNKKTGKYLLVNLFLAAFTVLTIIPVIYILKIAFAGGQSFSESPGLIPEGFDLKNFYDLFTTITDSEGNPLFLRQIFNSVIVSAATTLAGILIACSAAYCFSRFTFPGRKAGMIMFLVSQMFPGVMMMIPLYILMEKLHLLNTLAGLTLVYSTTTIPFSVWMLKGYFDTIPKELEEAALIDGAGTVRIFS
ncbi:MAG: ABC transporter permease subunit, partial [Deltaproteobacteria bacterium]|nr:ABC transporter permease subunit [Deltaproteobacteria bacterium]